MTQKKNHRINYTTMNRGILFFIQQKDKGFRHKKNRDYFVGKMRKWLQKITFCMRQ